MTRILNALALALALALVQAPAARAQNAPAPCVAPGVSFWSLLESVGVGYADGRLTVGRLYAVCLPAPARASASNYAYDPDGGGKLSTLVKTADGRVLNTFVWNAESIGGLWEMSRYKVVGGPQAVKPLGAGSYLLEFAVEDKPFYRFPFSVVEGKNEDPYQPPGQRYFVEGPWNEYGNVFYQRNDPQSSFKFTTWVQDKSGRPAQRSVPYEAKIVRARRQGDRRGRGDVPLRAALAQGRPPLPPRGRRQEFVPQGRRRAPGGRPLQRPPDD